MARTYELGIVFDPRQSDEAVQETVEKKRELIEESGSKVTEVDFWGRRKLAYPIQKFNEGKYVFIYITSETGSPPFTEIERLLRQNDKVLRFLTVRTDEDLKRAARKGKPGTPGGPGTPAPPEGAVADDEDAAPAADSPDVDGPAADTTQDETAVVEHVESAPADDADAPAETAASAEPEAEADADESTSSAKEE